MEDALKTAMAKRKQRIDEARITRNTTTLLDLMTASAEDAFTQYLGISSSEATAMKGRGQVAVKLQRVEGPPKAPANGSPAHQLERLASQAAGQGTRINNVANHMPKLFKETTLESQGGGTSGS